MLKYYDGTVFNTNAKTLVNTVNCMGVMGAGIALEFKLRYPKMFLEYAEMCKNGEYKVGKPKLHESDEINILNFPTKNHWRYPSRIEWIEEGLAYFSKNYRKENITSVAFPKLGTNKGGLDWDEVRFLMDKYLAKIEDVEIIICLDVLDNAEGIEKLMVDDFNTCDLSKIFKELRINTKVVEIIGRKLPINRFWKIGTINGIGDKTYEKIFNYFYTKHKTGIIDEKIIVQDQMSLFD